MNHLLDDLRFKASLYGTNSCATELRRKLLDKPSYDNLYKPIDWIRLKKLFEFTDSSNTPEERWKIAYKIGQMIGLKDCIRFADDFVFPLWIAEPLVCYGGVRTGKKKKFLFFWTYEETRAYTITEIMNKCEVTIKTVTRQLERLV